MLENTQISKDKKLILYFLLLLVSIHIISNFFQKNIFGDIGILGDSEIYYCAAMKFKLGINPYDFADCFGQTTMHYQYSLVALFFFYLLNYLSLETYKIIWLFLEIISFFTILIYCKKFLDLKKDFFNFFLVLFGFGGVCWSGLLSGNISIILYALISIAIYELYKKKIYIFCFLILIISFFKPYLLLFLILGFSLYKKEFIKYFIFTISLILFFHFISYLMQPEYFSNYLNVIFYSTSNEYYKNLGSGIGIIGLLDGLLNIFHSQHNNILISKIFWFLLAIIISITYLLNSKKNKKLNIINGILITNLLNPYLMNYDLYICIPCLIYLINKNLFFKNLKYNEYFCYFSLIFIIIVHDKFAPLLLSTLFLFIILRNSFFEKKLINT